MFQGVMPKSPPDYLSIPYKYSHFLWVDSVKKVGRMIVSDLILCDCVGPAQNS